MRSQRIGRLGSSAFRLSAAAVSMSLAGLGARTVPAALDMAAERSSAANLDRCHDALLGEVEVADIGRAPRLTMAAKNIR